MPAGARLDLVTETSDIKAGFKDVESALKSVEGSLDNVGEQGDETSDKLTRSFADAARETKKESREMAKGVNTSFDKMEKGSSKATDKMATSSASKAREVSASFDGSADSVVSGFQGAAAEMFEGFGPAGAVAGLAAAAGLGLITKSLTDSKEAAEEAAETTWSMAQEMVSAGLYMFTEAQKLNLFDELVGDEKARKKIQDDLDEVGVSWTDFIAAQVGLGDMRETTEKKIMGFYQDQRDTLAETAETDLEREVLGGKIEHSAKRLLKPLKEQRDLEGDVLDTALEIRDTFQRSGVVLNEANVELSTMKREAALISRQDATPKFDMSSAFTQVEDLQKRLNRLSIPDLNVNVRGIQ
jgi:hypothetical protein